MQIQIDICYALHILFIRFTRDMLPYWYNQMISHKLGRTFQVMDCGPKFELFVELISYLDMFPSLYLSVYQDILICRP